MSFNKWENKLGKMRVKNIILDKKAEGIIINFTNNNIEVYIRKLNKLW